MSSSMHLTPFGAWSRHIAAHWRKRMTASLRVEALWIVLAPARQGSWILRGSLPATFLSLWAQHR